ncbi:hypothetical protein [Bradyrhizobium sp. STM 3562]|uniref:hypothetical protein n=1 Tax=Bradyrhizobium sp. STM 3562 TaxID=578924 RepID=UPI00388FE052
MAFLYKGYDIESFEAGKGLWHARIRRADLQPFLIDGALFPKVEVGLAWPSQDAAVADAKQHIDRSEDRWSEPEAAEFEMQPFL